VPSCRWPAGRAFLRRRGHQRLGFARLGDYTRERLGLGAREVQELARVATQLEALPALADAFEAGLLSWAHIRVLTRVATADDARAWLQRASELTVRELTALVRQAAPREPDEVDDDTIDGEPTARFHVTCPRRVRGAWREAVELARRVAGEELAVWEVSAGCCGCSMTCGSSGSWASCPAQPTCASASAAPPARPAR
jgi:hypothetical protein